MSKHRPNRPVLGYFGAAAAAAISFDIQRNIIALLIESLEPYRPGQPMLLIGLFLIPAGTAYVGVVALVPWLLFVWITKSSGLRGPWCHSLGRAAIGWVLGYVIAPGYKLESDVDPTWLPVNRFLVGLLGIEPAFALSGVVFGLTYWWISDRRHDTENAS